MFLLCESTSDGGGTKQSWLDRDPAGVWLRLCDSSSEQGSHVDLRLPEGAVQAVMRRYAKPLDEALEPRVAHLDGALALGDGVSLVQFRFKPRFEVIAKDYVVLRVPGQPSLAELAVSVAAALTHLAQAFGVTADA